MSISEKSTDPSTPAVAGENLSVANAAERIGAELQRRWVRPGGVAHAS